MKNAQLTKLLTPEGKNSMRPTVGFIPSTSNKNSQDEL
jgi:hypothetical protein